MLVWLGSVRFLRYDKEYVPVSLTLLPSFASNAEACKETRKTPAYILQVLDGRYSLLPGFDIIIFGQAPSGWEEICPRQPGRSTGSCQFGKDDGREASG